jgi:localization factor PodJL
MPNSTDGSETAMADDATVKADMTASDGTMMMEPVTKPAEPEAMAATETPAAVQPAVAGIDVPDAVGPVELVTAARSGDSLALFEIGSRFTDGRGVKADLGEAVKWYQLAADKGQAVAQYRLANFYEKGNGVTQDIGKAKELYETSAGLGNASAMHNLAVLAATGRDGKPDMVTAAKWFKQAADMGVKDSQFNLAILYAQGKGVETDLTESYKWFAVAALGGDADAGQKRDEVAKVLKPDQLKAAMAKVDGWKAVPASAEANNPVVPDAWIEKSSSTSSIDMKKAITNIQAILNNNGFNVGKPDGLMGAKTVAAIKAFQTSVGQKPTGEITDALVKELLARNKKS